MNFSTLKKSTVIYLAIFIQLCSYQIAAQSNILSPSAHTLVITEIMYNPPETGTDTLEFVEIYNAGNYPVNLNGFQFTEGILHVFQPYTIIPGEYMVLALDSLAFYRTFGLHVLRWNSGRLTNTGELIKLIDNEGMTVDSVVYGISTPWPALPNGNGPSLLLCNPFTDNLNPANWSSCSDFAAINTAGDTIWATPMAGCSSWSGNPVANFYSTETNIFTNNSIDFQDVSIGNPISWQWSFEGGTPSVSSVQHPQNIVYHQAGIYQVCLTVSNSSGSDIQCVQQYIHVTDSLNSPLVITEIMYNPPESTDSLEYIEVYNNGLTPVALKDYYFSKGVAFVFPDMLLPAGAYCVVSQNASAVFNTFGINALQWTSGSLNNLGETIELNDRFGITVDSLTYGIALPWDTLAAGQGPSLVLCDAMLDNSVAENWIHSIEQAGVNASNEIIYGTPGTSCAYTSPVAAFISDVTVTIPGNPVTFTDKSHGLVSERKWEFEGGSPSQSSEPVVLVTYTQPGDYRACLKVSNIYGADSICTEAYIHVQGPVDHGIVITEIMYNSPDSNTDSLDFIEIYNAGNQNVDLDGFYFSSGITFTFPPMSLEPDSFLVIAKDDLIASDFYKIQCLKWQSGDLQNNGELILLKDKFGFTVDSVLYDDQIPWDTLADGYGHSLVLCDPLINNAYPESWLHAYDTAGQISTGYYVYANAGRGCSLTKPVANFTAGSTYNFINAPTGFSDLSSGNPTTWRWTFDGGNPLVSYEQNPSSVVYGESGSYKVCLKVSNSQGSDSLCRSRYVHIVPEGSAKIQMTEIMYNPPDVNVDTLEFIELRSFDTIPIDMYGFTFSSGINYLFPKFNLLPDSMIVVAKDAAVMKSLFGINCLQWGYGSNLNNAGELLVFNDKSGSVIDSVRYSGQRPWPVEADGTGRSLTLCNTDLDNSIPENWIASHDIAAIKPNGDTIRATPGYQCDAGKPLFRIACDYPITSPGGTVKFSYINLNWAANAIKWYFEGGSPDSVILWQPVIIYDSLGAYGVRVVASNSYGTTDMYFPEFIEVIEGHGITEFDNKIAVWPNPTSGIFNIQSDIPLALIKVYDANGTVISSEVPASFKSRIDLTGFKSGLYFVKIIAKSGKTSTKKLILHSF